MDESERREQRQRSKQREGRAQRAGRVERARAQESQGQERPLDRSHDTKKRPAPTLATTPRSHVASSPRVEVSDKGGLKLVLAPQRPHKLPPRANTKVALEEDDYIDSLQSIISRDYFQAPDTSQLRADLPADLPADAPGTSLSLSEFQAKYTSEDNASYEQLTAQPGPNRTITAGDSGDSGDSGAKAISAISAGGMAAAPDAPNPILDSWKSSIKNALLFYPQGNHPNPKPKGSITPQNTRLTQENLAADSESNHDLARAALNGTQGSGSGSGGPQVEGYGFVTENTFRIADPPEYEQKHQRLLAKRANATTTANSKRIGSKIAKTPSAYGRPMSPAASDFLASSRSRRHTSFLISATPKHKSTLGLHKQSKSQPGQ